MLDTHINFMPPPCEDKHLSLFKQMPATKLISHLCNQDRQVQITLQLFVNCTDKLQKDNKIHYICTQITFTQKNDTY